MPCPERLRECSDCAPACRLEGQQRSTLPDWRGIAARAPDATHDVRPGLGRERPSPCTTRARKAT
jgi:hypothetical protein